MHWVYVIYTPTFVKFLGELFSEVEEFCHCNQVEPVFYFWKLLPVSEYLVNREKIYTTPPARLAEWVEQAVIHAGGPGLEPASSQNTFHENHLIL